MRASRRRRIAWELVTCGVLGHALVGTDAATVRPEDALIVREYDGLRWHHCLRCDSWLPLAPPAAPAREHPPSREEIEIPPRGKALRDKIWLRVIAADRALHFAILLTLGIVVLVLAAHEHSARHELERVLTALQTGVAGGVVQTRGRVGLIHELDKLLTLHSRTLHELAFGLFGYALLEGLEAIGLWLMKRWAEYLTFLATVIPLPLEVYEIISRVAVLKVIGFLINLAIVVYLLVAKRLFGVRGGGKVDEKQRAEGMSWEALEHAAPVPASAPQPTPTGAG